MVLVYGRHGVGILQSLGQSQIFIFCEQSEFAKSNAISVATFFSVLCLHTHSYSMTASQWTDKATGFDNISIIIHWEDDPSDEYPYQWKFEVSFGQFWFLVGKKDDKFSFWLVVDGPRYSSMSGYKSCKVQLLGGKVLGNFPFIYNFFGNYRIGKWEHVWRKPSPNCDCTTKITSQRCWINFFSAWVQ